MNTEINKRNRPLKMIGAIIAASAVLFSSFGASIGGIKNANAETFAPSQIANHNTQSDCWIIISGKVYNITSYILNHPGGIAAIVAYCGKDATSAFTGQPHSSNANNILASYYVGDVGAVSGSTPTPTPTSTPTPSPSPTSVPTPSPGPTSTPSSSATPIPTPAISSVPSPNQPPKFKHDDDQDEDEQDESLNENENEDRNSGHVKENKSENQHSSDRFEDNDD